MELEPGFHERYVDCPRRVVDECEVRTDDRVSIILELNRFSH